LFHRGVKVALLFLVFPGEEVLLPDVGKTFAAARSVSATGFHFLMNSAGVMIQR
jgi:hypothetical protein